MEITVNRPKHYFRKKIFQRNGRGRIKDEEHTRHARRMRILLVVVLAVSLLPPVFMNSVFGYLPVIVVGLIFLFSFLYVKVLKKALEFEEQSDFSNCRRGTDSGFAIHIRNHSPLIFTRLEIYFYVSDMFGGSDNEERVVITLAPFEDRLFEFDIRFAHIGTYEAGVNRVVMEDLLGIFPVTLQNEKHYQVCVSPKIYDVRKLHISNQTFSEQATRLIPNAMDGSDYAGVREYVIGDPIKHIHWKLSARTTGYMTRQFESYGNSGLAIIMDFECPSYDSESMMNVFDGVVETALSLERYARENGIESEISYIDKDGRSRRHTTSQRTDIWQMIRTLPRMQAARISHTATKLLTQISRDTYAKGNLAFCTGNVNAALVRTLVELKTRKKYPILFVILPESVTRQDREDYIRPLRSLDYAGIRYYILDSADQLQKGERRR